MLHIHTALVLCLEAVFVLTSPLNHNHNSQTVGTCVHNNKTYTAGEKFKPDPCTFCHCHPRSGRAFCAIMDCLFEANCIQYTNDTDVCCQSCLKRGCHHRDGKLYQPGEEIASGPCEYCFCPLKSGRTVCVKASCPRLTCVDPVKKPGECCATCPNGPNCWLGDRVIRGGERINVNKCKTCMCPNYPAPFWRTSKDVKAICTMNVGEDCVHRENEGRINET